MSIDVLEDHDRVVDDAAHRDRKAAQGHDVHRDSGDLHEDEGHQEREGNAHRRDERGAQAGEEREDREDREDRAEPALAEEPVA
jgi:hypothetical protein